VREREKERYIETETHRDREIPIYAHWQVNKVLMGQRAKPAAGAMELRLFHGTKPDSVDKINAQVGDRNSVSPFYLSSAREELSQPRSPFSLSLSLSLAYPSRTRTPPPHAPFPHTHAAAAGKYPSHTHLAYVMLTALPPPPLRMLYFYSDARSELLMDQRGPL
jgi:hypothetical protein